MTVYVYMKSSTFSFLSVINSSIIWSGWHLKTFAAATPKQIRELMQVDGLTNDEVKSHLQVSHSFRDLQHFIWFICLPWMVSLTLSLFQKEDYFGWFHTDFSWALQKYRLHTRRLPTTKETYPSSRSAVLGDLWMNHEGKHSESSRVGDSQSGSPQGPFQLASNKSRISLTRRDSIEEDDENEKLGKVNV